MRPPLPHVELPFLIVHGNLIWPVLVLWLASAFMLVRRCAPSNIEDSTTGSTTFSWIVSGVIAIGLLYGAGHIAVGHMARGNVQPESLSSLSAIGVSAALPGSREEALDFLDSRFERDPVSKRSLALATEWSAYRGDCYAEELQKYGELDAAIAEGLRCGSIHIVIHALYLAGRYQEAIAVERLFDDVTLDVAIAVGDWNTTAEILDDLGKSEDPNETNPSECLAALARTYAGQKNAFAHLAHRSNAMCRVVETTTLAPDLRRAVFLGPLWSAERTREDFLTGFYAGNEMPWSDDHLLPSSPIPTSVFFAPHFEGSLAGDDAMRFQRQRAIYEILRGDMPASRAALEGLRDADAEDLLDQVSVRDGSFTLPHDTSYYEPGVGLAVRSGGAIPESAADAVYDDNDCRRTFVKGLVAAQKGDGALLLGSLKRCMPSPMTAPIVLIGLGPRIHSHGEGLSDLTFYRSRRLASYERLSDWLAALVDRRDMRLRLGEASSALDDQHIIDLHLDALSDLHKLTMMWLIGNHLWI